MESEIIISYISAHLKSVERQLRRYKKDRNTERLHRLRVDIKKVRAILDFIEKIYQHPFNVHPLKEVFKNAGEIRMHQITLEVLNTLQNTPQNVMLQLKGGQQQLELQFMKGIPYYLYQVKNFREKNFFHFILPDKKIIGKYINKKRKKAGRNFNCHEREKMHQFRKLIKSIMYLYSMLPGRFVKSLDLDTVFINKVQKEVGCWHDTYSAISLLSKINIVHDQIFICSLNQLEDEQFENLFDNYPKLKI